MDTKSIDSEIQKNLVRQGTLKKRSKFLKEWRDRWVILTTNFLFTFTNSKREELTDIVEIKEIEGIKSYLKKSDDMTALGFKVESTENTLVLMAKDKHEKWSWMVTLERLLDFKMSKSSSDCKSIDDVKNMGFQSMNEYISESAASDQPEKPSESMSAELESIYKMVQLFKSQEEQNNLLQEQVKALLQNNIENGPSNENLKQISSKVDELFASQEHSKIDGIVKGMLIMKKIEKEDSSQKLKVVEALVQDCNSERISNWVGQLKTLL